ncbi:hypothetical protein [Mesorhizobium sp. B2-3-4]|uniref:hypothetical protein n=1 Tax=Mesorhizobium sp. B2-3-4 TaxID=2589959 RepID=UPI00112CE67A|nr:hypothetical protein [Mesorhizobium sp. B2-3-4]TPM41396.1 hypothetical protein FJ967_00215 [Mesorhizobium sp. B2-3-4]
MLENLIGLHQKSAIPHGVKKLVFLGEAVHKHLEQVGCYLLPARALQWDRALLAYGFVNAGKHRKLVVHDDLAGIQHSLSSKATKREECDKRVKCAINFDVIERLDRLCTRDVRRVDSFRTKQEHNPMSF